MSRPRILVFAYSDVGHSCLKFLLDRKENVICVYTHADNPDEQPWFPSVEKCAHQYSIPVRIEKNLEQENEQAFLRSLAPELIFSFYYRHLIPSSILGLPKLGCFNMHGSFLPKYRGRAPVNWAVLHGETKTGATLHEMVEKPDAGDIVDQETVTIGPDDTAAVVQSAVTKAAVTVLERQIENLKAGTAPRKRQDASQASYFGRRRPEDGEIQWTWTAEKIHNLVRALSHPYPGAFGKLMGEKTFIWKTRLRWGDSFGGQARLQPGSVLVDNGELHVMCGDGNSLEILRLQRDGEEEMNGPEFISGHMTATRENKL